MDYGQTDRIYMHQYYFQPQDLVRSFSREFELKRCCSSACNWSSAPSKRSLVSRNMEMWLTERSCLSYWQRTMAIPPQDDSMLSTVYKPLKFFLFPPTRFSLPPTVLRGISTSSAHTLIPFRSIIHQDGRKSRG